MFSPSIWVNLMSLVLTIMEKKIFNFMDKGSFDFNYFFVDQ